jgi:hypothetical protein
LALAPLPNNRFLDGGYYNQIYLTDLNTPAKSKPLIQLPENYETTAMAVISK